MADSVVDLLVPEKDDLGNGSLNSALSNMYASSEVIREKGNISGADG